ncbi:hypothetical protein PSI22_20290 [Xenorhabdus sp. XENO-7]|uniref:Uncharacterized protein n=1 Tax=Xenorhabdus aichiensis TaxID=3025874 RepID=A0ABT5MA26_9GAMM|nr:hypothetical protein [Xenorhabdus aichiensis]MDC9623910.1 hypothetical protein [Xenorhabdus aichiensis]
MKIISFLMLFLVSFSSLAGWKYEESLDKMRGKTINYATLHSKKNDNGIKIALLATSINNKNTDSIKIIIGGDEADCGIEEFCIGYIKYDDGRVNELPFIILGKNKRIINVVEYHAVTDSLRLSQRVFIEIPLKSKGATQFELYPHGLRFAGYQDNVEFINIIGGVDFKQPYSSIYAKAKDNKPRIDGAACSNVDKSDYSLMGVKANVEMCFYNERLVMASFSLPKSNKLRNKLISAINKNRGTSEEAMNGHALWLSDDFSSISTIFMFQDNKNIEIKMIYQPNSNFIPAVDEKL